MSSESKEYLTIVKCASQLATALHSDRDIAHHLRANGFLPGKIYDDVMDPRSMCSASDKADELVNGIRRGVEQSPTYFHKLVDSLRNKEGKYKDILEIIEKTYSELSTSCDQASALSPQPELKIGEYN